MSLTLLCICLAKTDDPHHTVHHLVTQNVQSVFKISNSDFTPFSIAEDRTDDRIGEIEIRGAVEAQLALTNVSFVLGRVVRDVHNLILGAGLRNDKVKRQRQRF